jgi:molybdopterin molybdotransferase
MDVWDAFGRRAVTCNPVLASRDIPSFPRAMMDGFAVHRENLRMNERLRVAGDVYAGQSPGMAVFKGHAVQVRTGAPVPAGSGAVVRKEWIEWTDDHTIQILRDVSLGESIQEAGEDARVGSTILREGTVVDGQARTVLRTSGIHQVEVFSPVRVGILATGSELIQNPVELQPGQIYAASDAFLVSALRDLGATVTDIRFVKDDLEAIKETIAHLVGRVDYLLITGGASVGDTDYVKTAVQQVSNQDQLPLNRVWMRPGSPFVATKIGSTTIYGMSGNPAACFVQFHVLAIQAIRWSMGYSSAPFAFTGTLGQQITVKPVKHIRFYRATARLEQGTLMVYPEGSQSSGMITGLPSVNAIIRLDDHTYQEGCVVPVQFTSQLF